MAAVSAISPSPRRTGTEHRVQAAVSSQATDAACCSVAARAADASVATDDRVVSHHRCGSADYEDGERAATRTAASAAASARSA